MSSDSSRGSSPARFGIGSPSSDTDEVAHISWKPSASTFHSSADSQTSAASSTPILRQPVGFGTGPPSVPTYQASPTQPPTNAQQFLPGQTPVEDGSAKSPKKPSKCNEKGTPKETVDSSLCPGAAIAMGMPGQLTFVQDAPLERKAFRVESYTNNPSAIAQPYNGSRDGPYGSAYRASIGGQLKGKTSKSSKRSKGPAQDLTFKFVSFPGNPAPQLVPEDPPRPSAYYYPYQHMQLPENPPSHYQSRTPPPQSTPECRPQSSYYRYDYDKLRESAPSARAAKAAAAAASASRLSRNPSNSRSSDREPRRYSLRSSQRSEPFVPHADNHHASPSSPPETPCYNSSRPLLPPLHPSTYAHPPVHSPPYVPPSPEKQHSPEARSQRHSPPSHSGSDPRHGSSTSTSSVAEAHPHAARPCRVLTLLIEDKRNPDDDCFLAEVKVPLKPADNEDEGFWADAQLISQELQKGPSRIDGSAKVYTMRGKYKQYFLRVTPEGEAISQSANLKVTPDRTLEIVVEDNEPTASKPRPAHNHSSPPGARRRLLTPVSERVKSPSPVWSPRHSKRSSLFSVEDPASPSEERFEGRDCHAPTTLDVPSKRPRSTSMQSLQSSSPDNYTLPSLSRTSPFGPRVASTVHSPSPPSTSVPPNSQSPEPAAASPIHQSPKPPDPSPPPPQPVVIQPPRSTAAFGFSYLQPASASMRIPSLLSTPSPSPPKKAKLAVAKERPSDQRSVSPAPSRPPPHQWTASRTPSLTDSSTPAIACKNRPATVTIASPAPPQKRNPFEQYGNSFSLASRLVDPTRSPSAGATFPSLSTVSMTGHPPGTTSAAPTTLAPSATSLTQTLAGTSGTALDQAVGTWIRGFVSKEPAWETFVERRRRTLKISEQLEQYKYVQRVFDRYVGTTTPADLEGAGSVTITKLQVLRAFNLPVSWGDECTETLVLTTLYGPGGTRCDDARVRDMMDAEAPVTTTIHARRFLTLLREIHGQWTIAHPDG